MEFRDSTLTPGLVEGLDEAGRVVWISSSEGTWGIRHDVRGRTVELTDALGDSTQLTYDADGCRVEARHQRLLAGDWREREVCDAGGQPVAVMVDPDAGTLGDVEAKLLAVGIDPAAVQPAPTVREVADPAGTTTTRTTPYAEASTWTPTDLSAGILARERTRFRAISMTVEAWATDQGVLVRDDRGGWRLERGGDAGLESVSDAAGRVVEIERDDLGRPTEILLGELFALRYTYADASPVWTAKTVVDLRDSRVVFAWNAATRQGETAARAHEVVSMISIPGAIRAYRQCHL